MEIRDNRQKEWLWLDNQYLNGYAKHLGVYCTVVYLSLCRYANNKTQTCFPSMKLIATENKISIKSVERAIKLLEEWKIVSVERSKKPDGTQSNNIYTLTSKNIWKSKPTDSQTIGNQQTISPEPTDSQVESRPTEVLHNNTNNNNTNITIAESNSADINLLIESFSKINPACKNFYGNKTQRKACQDLIDTYGFERIKVIIEQTLPRTNIMEYSPVCTTPVKLRDKFTELEAFILKKKSNQQEKLSKNKVAF